MSNSRKKLAASLIAAALLAQTAPISVLAAEDSVSPTDLPPAVSPSDAPTFHEALKEKLQRSMVVLPSYNDANSDILMSDQCGENITCTLYIDGLLKLEGTGLMYTYDDDNNLPPWYWDSESVKTLEISNNISSISSYAFESLPNLTTVVNPFRWSVPKECFHNCGKLSSITLNEGISYIGADAFSCCYALKSIVIPKSVTSIGSDAFTSSGLTDVYYPGTEDEWNKISIGTDTKLRTLKANGKIHFNYGNILIEGKCGDNVTGTLLKDGRLILSGSGAIYDYDSFGKGTPWESHNIRDTIKSVEFSSDSNITQLGYGIFQGFYNATSVTIPNTVTSIGKYAFSEWYDLESVVIPDSVTVLHHSAFNHCESLKNVTLPKNLTSIGDYAFNSNAITEIAFPNTLTTIKSYAFNNTKLTSLTIPDSVTTIEQTAFGYCEQLESVTLPNALPSIEYGTFIDCKSLKTITIPRSVTSIAKNAFGNDTGEAPPLTDVYYGGSEYDWSRIAIDSGNDALTNATIHYTEYDVNPNVNGAASKMYEPWGLRYFATFDGADSDKIADRGIAILKDTNYTEGMTPEAFCADTHAFVFRESAGKVAFDSQFNAYYATLEEGIYSYDIAAKYYVVPFAELANGETVYGSIKSNSMENVMNTNLTRDDVPDTEKAVTRCILALKESVAAHYAAEGIPGASADLTIPRGSSQTAASSVKTTEQSGVTPNIYAGASRLIEPWGLRYFASYAGSTDSVKERGVVILKETDYQESYSNSPDSMRLNANAYIFRSNDGTLVSDDGTNYYATVSQGISSENISDVYYVVPFVVLNDDSYVYGTVKSNSMLNIMNANLQDTSIPATEKAVTEDIVDLYNAVKAHYAS